MWSAMFFAVFLTVGDRRISIPSHERLASPTILPYVCNHACLGSTTRPRAVRPHRWSHFG